MPYVDTYKSRVEYLGATKQEIARNSGILEFNKLLDENESTVRGLSVDLSGLTFDGVILTNKQDVNEATMRLLVGHDVSLLVGDVITWGTEHWIVYQKQSRAYNPHQVFYITRCNYELHWVDENKNICSTWCHLVSSKDSVIKENFRTWNSLITPQPNRYLEILMPAIYIRRYTEFIVDEEKWYMVERDGISVPGIWYISCTETKHNALTDDLVSEIANTNELNTYTISAPNITCITNTVVTPQYTVYKNGGAMTSAEVTTAVSGNLTLDTDGVITAGEVGAGTITLSYSAQNGDVVSCTIAVTITPDTSISMYLVGPDTLKLGRSAEYELKSSNTITNAAIFAVSDSTLGAVSSISNTKCSISANTNNKLGTLTLTATLDGNEYTKQVKIVSLWW